MMNYRKNIGNILSYRNFTQNSVQIFELKIISSVWFQFCGLKFMSSVKCTQSRKMIAWEKFNILKPQNIPKLLAKMSQHLSSISAPCTIQDHDLENFQKNWKKIKNSKMHRKSSQKCSNMFWTCFEVIFLKKNSCPVYYGGLKFGKISKTKKFQNSKNMPKSV